ERAKQVYVVGRLEFANDFSADRRFASCVGKQVGFAQGNRRPIAQENLEDLGSPRRYGQEKLWRQSDVVVFFRERSRNFFLQNGDDFVCDFRLSQRAVFLGKASKRLQENCRDVAGNGEVRVGGFE